jgi:cysteine desulfurase
VIYFDHNATSPMLPQARHAWLEAAELYIGNPSSPHRLGSRAEMALTTAREKLASFLTCDPLEIVFTSGATEGNNTIFQSLAAQPTVEEVWISALEHPSVVEPARRLFGKRMRLIPVLRSGVVDLEWVRENLNSKPPALLVCMAANNETGVIQPWPELAALARFHGIPFFCDATQWVGRLPAAGLAACDYVTGSAHKFGGPRGTGFLKCSTNAPFRSLIAGGAQEEGRRAGTENVPGILSMVAALEIREQQMRNASPPGEARLFEKALAGLAPGREIVGGTAERLWNTVSVLMPQADCEQRWVVKLDKLGFAVSTGSACSSGKEQPSHVLTAMGYSASEASRALRFSCSWETTPEEWQALAEAVAKTHRATQRTER